MKSSLALTAAKTVIRWLRWAAVLALVYTALGGLVYAALGREAWALQPAPLAAVQNVVSMFVFHSLTATAIVVAGAMMAPRFHRTTAIVLGALHIPLALWNNVLSRVSLVEFVLLQGSGSYRQFTLEALGTVLGVVYILWSERANGPIASAPPAQLSPLEPPPASAGTRTGLTAAKTLIRWLRWAVVLTLVFCELGGLVYSASGTLINSALGQEAPAARPAPLAAVQALLGMVVFHVLREMGVVVAGALIAPRFRLATAIVLAALHVPLSFWGHVLATGGPWRSWTINYTHFTLEAFGSLLGVAYIFWSEKANGTVASVPASRLRRSQP
jgi:hypothetical protein